MQNHEFSGLKYEDFPVRLFFRLLGKDEAVAERFLGKAKWSNLIRRWEEDDKSMEKERLLEDQIRAMLSLYKAQKATTALKWLSVTGSDPKPILEEVGLPWRDTAEELVEALTKYIKKHTSQYENNLIMLEATMKQQSSGPTIGESKFTIDDGIAGLNLAGFTITDPDKLTIGQYQAMNRAIQRNGKR